MRIQAVLFDLDGTLLPMDNEQFTKVYFKLLAQKMAPLGYDPERLVQSVWAGTKAMVQNDGTERNQTRFWNRFAELEGERAWADIPVFDRFYADEFRQAVTATRPNPMAATAVRMARDKFGKAVLATNPLFPLVAIRTRLEWINLTPDDFDWVTTYEVSGYCKPNPDYYLEIARKIGVVPADCLMIGNDAGEDIAAAKAAGMQTYQVIDCAIGRGEGPAGSFAQMIDYISNL